MADTKATISQIKSIYGRLVYTHKSYEKLYDFTISCGNWLKFLQIFFSAVTTVGLVTILIRTQKGIEIITEVTALQERYESTLDELERVGVAI